MIVVVILGILAGIGIQQYGRVQGEAKEKADQANVRVIKSAVQMYLLTLEDDVDVSTVTLDKVVEAGYLDGKPDNPLGGGDYEIELREEDGVIRVYVTPSEDLPEDGD
jgi:type II secretory pathway pseudopilin PulG